MKNTIICFALALTAIVASAAVPSYQAFKGTGGIVITTNPPNGDVTIDGSLIASGGVNLSTNVYTNVVYVNAVGTRYAAATSLTNAIWRASAGTLVVVGPGTYELRTNETSMTLKHGVDQYWMPGSKFVVGISNTTQNMFDDSFGALTSSIYGYGEFYLTNFGGGGSILSGTGNGTKVRFEHNSIRTWAPGGDLINAGSGVSFDILTRSDVIASYQYDAFIASAGVTRARWDILGDIYTGGDIIEAGYATNRGDIFMSFRNGFGNLGNGSAGLMKLGGNVEVKFDRLVDTGGSGAGASITRGSGGSTNYAYVNGGTIEAYAASGTGLVRAHDATSDTQIHFKHVTLKGPTGFDTILATNLHPMILEQCSIIPGASSTNWARGQVPSGIRIIGELGLSTSKPYAANITLSGVGVHSSLISGAAAVTTLDASGDITALNITALAGISATGDIGAGGALSLGLATPSRVAMIDSFGLVTNVTSGSASTHYLHPDGSSDAGPGSVTVSTNSMSNIGGVLYARTFEPDFEIWDNFDREVATGVGIPGYSTSGYQWKNRGLGTNWLKITGGRMYLESPSNTATYVWATNTTQFAPNVWTRFGATVGWFTNGPATGYKDTIGIVVAANHDLGSPVLHTYFNHDQVLVELGIGGTPVLYRTWYLDPTQTGGGKPFEFDMQIVSNTVYVTCGPYQFSAYHSSLYQYASQPVVMFEILGSTTNQVRGWIDNIRVGHAKSYLQQADTYKLTNGISGERFVEATIVNGSYTNQPEDRIVGYTGNGTNRLVSAALNPGISVKVMDYTGTAESSPIYIATVGGETIDNGPTVTNLNINNGTMHLVSDTVGWRIVSRSSSSSGGGTPAGSSGAIQFVEGSSFAGTNDFTFNRSNRTVYVPKALKVDSGSSQITLTNLAIQTDGTLLRLGAKGTNFWALIGVDGAPQLPGDLVPLLSAFENNIGNNDPTLPQINEVRHTRTITGLVSNRVYNAPGAASTVTIYGTNQYWNVNVTSNLTFADSGLNGNVVYWIKLTNNASTISFPATWRWLDDPLIVTAPSLLNGEYVIRLQKFENGTNAWTEVGPLMNLAVASAGANGYLVMLTNASKSILTLSNSYIPQAATMVLSNLAGTVANNVTNVVSLSTSNATSKPLSNSYTSGVLTLFGLEGGANTTITPNASNLVISVSALPALPSPGYGAVLMSTGTQTNWSIGGPNGRWVINEEFWAFADVGGQMGSDYWGARSQTGTYIFTNIVPNAFGGFSISPRTAGTRWCQGLGNALLPTTYMTNATLWFQARVMTSMLDGGGDTNTLKIGFFDTVSTEPANGIYWRSTNNVWELVTARSGSRTTTASLSNVVANAWQVLGWYLDPTGTNVIGYVGSSETNLVAVATNSLNIPHDTLTQPMIYVQRGLTNSTAGMTNFFDYYKLWVRQ